MGAHRRGSVPPSTRAGAQRSRPCPTQAGQGLRPPNLLGAAETSRQPGVLGEGEWDRVCWKGDRLSLRALGALARSASWGMAARTANGAPGEGLQGALELRLLGPSRGCWPGPEPLPQAAGICVQTGIRVEPPVPHPQGQKGVRFGLGYPEKSLRFRPCCACHISQSLEPAVLEGSGFWRHQASISLCAPGPGPCGTAWPTTWTGGRAVAWVHKPVPGEGAGRQARPRAPAQPGGHPL